MEIALSAKHERLLYAQIENGRFETADEAVGAALELLQYYDPEKDEEIKRKVRHAAEQLARGEYVSLKSREDIAAFADEIHRRGLERLAARRRNGG
jgi:Arc/MetJ-type ribon-helix-helix transcriptional regulator